MFSLHANLQHNNPITPAGMRQQPHLLQVMFQPVSENHRKMSRMPGRHEKPTDPQPRFVPTSRGQSADYLGKQV